jgi:Ran GTPase-activating protein (RanGAP) involved in mRNA processing and transport
LLGIIAKKARVLDLSYNSIGKIGSDHICKAVTSRECRIEILELEDNKLGDFNIVTLCKSLQKNRTLKVLNLSKNYISNRSVEYIAGLLDGSFYIEEMYLHWNQITNEGGKAIFTALLENENLRVLDLSNNSLGIGASPCASEISSFARKNLELRHFDLSNN